MPSAYALGIVSGNSILDFGVAERLRALRCSFFTGGLKMGNGSCSAASFGHSRPLHTKQKSHRFCISASTMASYWSGRRGSNSLPPPWQGGALPDELRPHIRCIYPCTLPFLNGAPAKACEARFCGEKEKIWYSSQKSCLQDFPMNDRIFDVVPPIGIEPMTRGFSVPCSTD